MIHISINLEAIYILILTWQNGPTWILFSTLPESGVSIYDYNIIATPWPRCFSKGVVHIAQARAYHWGQAHIHHESKVSCFLVPLLLLPPLNFKDGNASTAHCGDLNPIHRALPDSLCLKSGCFGVGCMFKTENSMFCRSNHEKQNWMCFSSIHTLSVLLSHQFAGLSSRSRHNSESKRCDISQTGQMKGTFC